MDTKTLTLVEFLEAQLIEDEARTYRLVPYACDPGCCAPEGWVGHQCVHCDTIPQYGGTVEAITEIAEQHDEDVHQRTRVLREVETKRAILALAPILDAMEEKIAMEWTTRPGPLVNGATLLGHLAAVYSDHADYRDNWAHVCTFEKACAHIRRRP